MGERKENKNKEVEKMLVLLANLEQIKNRLEFAAGEVAWIHQAEAGNDVRKTKGEESDVTQY